jgi:hypothetical protein
MRRQFLSLVSGTVATSLLLSSCITQSWEIPSTEFIPHGAVERPPESPQISLYFPEYLSEGPSFAKHDFLPPPHFVLDALKKKIEGQHESSLFKVTRTPQETGVFCSLQLEEAEIPAMIEAWSVLTPLTLWLLPFYDSSLGYRITYELFVDAKLKKRYQYQVRGKTFEWAAAVFVMPFMSGNWHVKLSSLHSVNEDLLQGLWLTSRMFWEDARNDGYL